MRESTDLAIKTTLFQMVGIRDRALKGYEALRSATDDLNKIPAALNDKAYRLPVVHLSISHRRDYNSPSVAEYRRALDSACWYQLLEASELRNIMGAKQKAAFTEQIEKEPPEFNMENALATFGNFAENAASIFIQGLVDVFEALPRDFRSHDGFKLGQRCIFEYAVSFYAGHPSWSYNGHVPVSDRMMDLDRVFHQLAKAPWTHKLVDVCRAQWQDKDKRREPVVTRFFKVRWFEKGSIHVYLLDVDTTREANRLLAHHYGPALGQMHLHPDDRRAA